MVSEFNLGEGKGKNGGIGVVYGSQPELWEIGKEPELQQPDWVVGGLTA